MPKTVFRWLAPLLVAAVATTGCTPPPKAPSELNDLVHYLYREWENDDPRVMEAGIANLETFLRDLDPDEGLHERSFEVTPLSAEDLETITREEERDPSKCFGVFVSRASAHSVDRHVLLQTDDDQLPAEPSAKAYKREFRTDRECFRKKTCDVLRTKNDLTRQNALMHVDMVLYKDFRWVKVPAPEGGDEAKEDRYALVARSWTPKSYASHDDENTAIHQSYSLDIVVPVSDGPTWRLQVVYSETQGLGGNDIQMAVVTGSTHDGLEAADKTIAERHAK